MKDNFKIFNTSPKIIAKIEMESDKLFNIEMSVKDELSHIAIMKLREFLKDTNKFVGTSHVVTVYNMTGKKIDQTTLYII